MINAFINNVSVQISSVPATLFVQQYKYPRFKGCLPMVVKCSVIQALYSARNFAALYFFFGKLH